MKNLFVFILSVIFFISCGDAEHKKQVTPVKKESTSLEDAAKRYIENQLMINAAESYKFKMYQEQLTADTIMDAVFIVQRDEYATSMAEKENAMEYFKKIGYSANQNYIFVYNGKTKKYATVQPIGANVNIPLEVEFKSILSPAKKDIIVSYTILNGKFNSYYAYNGNSILTVLNHPVYNKLGEEDEQLYSVKYSKGTFSVAKDIDLYLGKDVNPTNKVTGVGYTPKIEATNKLFLKFMFDPKKAKYVTKGLEK